MLLCPLLPLHHPVPVPVCACASCLQRNKEHGWTPLHAAAAKGNLGSAAVLLAAGASPAAGEWRIIALWRSLALMVFVTSVPQPSAS